tara:strand:+ start:28 stop:666 length:639 start_codon:yes stop_codon:yes gene_type:complete
MMKACMYIQIALLRLLLTLHTKDAYFARVGRTMAMRRTSTSIRLTLLVLLAPQAASLVIPSAPAAVLATRPMSRAPPPKARAPKAPKAPKVPEKTEEEKKNIKIQQNFAAAFGYFALFGQLAAPFAAALGRLGLIKPPPLNLLTDIANQAMDEAIANEEIPKLMGTVYGQGIWKDLIGQYYNTGETTEFLTKAGGVCAEHAGWCAGITIPSL